MYCPKCGVHFSGLGGDKRCPHCGQPVEPTKEAPAPTARAVEQPRAGDADRTRTEASQLDLWAPGSIVAGKYEVLSRLGAGGFGTVYKVRHIFRKKYYALKTPHAEFSRDEVFRRRFEREIEAMERFVHPDAVMIRDSGVTEHGWPYYTMDFIDGESLKVVLQREGRLPLDRALHVAVRILRVLDVAHSHDIIHRDIKPDNVLLTRVGGREAVKVLDFGVAKLLDIASESGSITHGERVGTPKYMSPEQITGEPVDARSDLFSLGILLYEMATGRHPFASVRDPIRITAAILNRDPAAPRELVPEMPRALSDLILSMIEKKAKRRPATAGVLLRQLESLCGSVSSMEPRDRLELCHASLRTRAAPLVLRQETSAGERRCFVLFDEKVAFGRSSQREKGIVNQLILRCLPCRSQARDPENWQRNLTISHRVGWIYPDVSVLVIEPCPDAAHGIGISGVKSHKTARLQVDRFALSLGDRALEFDGYRVLSSTDGSDLDLSFLDDGRPPGLEPPVLTGYSNRSCRIDCVCLLRTNNWPLHEYYLVYRILKIGSSANSALRLRGKDVEGTHAAILYEGGEAFFLAYEDGVTVLGLQSAAHAGVPSRDSEDLRPGRLLPIVPGLEIIIGDNHLFVDSLTESQFKTT